MDKQLQKIKDAKPYSSCAKQVATLSFLAALQFSSCTIHRREGFLEKSKLKSSWESLTSCKKWITGKDKKPGNGIPSPGDLLKKDKKGRRPIDRAARKNDTDKFDLLFDTMVTKIGL
ncbi:MULTISPECIES: hypothetical protein [unclassified Candidatus Cardinium]|uniref:hypothetical protein n=1 Tax=unclassified Candidatus Cardinium TaxID=2641185 RepID=UPI001FB27502|nr:MULTISPECIES: hypothetical protein [unclassified Candidatus Cardinium]